MSPNFNSAASALQGTLLQNQLRAGFCSGGERGKMEDDHNLWWSRQDHVGGTSERPRRRKGFKALLSSSICCPSQSLHQNKLLFKLPNVGVFASTPCAGLCRLSRCRQTGDASDHGGHGCPRLLAADVPPSNGFISDCWVLTSNARSLGASIQGQST